MVSLAESCVLVVFCVFSVNVDHGGRRGDTAQALARWWHPVAASEVLDVLHRAMRLALHRRIRMVIKTDSDSPAFSVIAN